MEKARIFVADDDGAYLELMKELLEDEGYLVQILHSAKNAYEEIVAHLPDLVVLDIMIRNPDAGFILLDMIKLNPKTKKIPVLICSADARSLRLREEYLKKMHCFVVEKPFDIEDLLVAIEQALTTTMSHELWV